MPRLPILLLLAAIAPALTAQNQATIDQMDQLLGTLHGQKDAKVAEQLAALELTERASSARLSKWQSDFRGARTRQALAALADASVFFSPPAAELPANPPPDSATQKQILERTVDYVRQTLPKLPNFLAQRATTRFEVATRAQLDEQHQLQLFQLRSANLDLTALGLVHGEHSNGSRLYYAGTWDTTVTYRDGHEVIDSSITHTGDRHPPPVGLSTEGEFGPILYVVLGDAIHSHIAWSHWEQGANGPLSVFRYEVPTDNSHYTVVSVQTGNTDFPAYHGEIAVDSATGAIARISVESNETPPDPATESGIAVEYGPVVIGGITYNCPLRGVALSKAPSHEATGTAKSSPVMVQTYLNDVSFTQYRIFRTEIRILPATPQTPATQPPPTDP
jgi:hypothetical protein